MQAVGLHGSVAQGTALGNDEYGCVFVARGTFALMMEPRCRERVSLQPMKILFFRDIGVFYKKHFYIVFVL
jgi:hypothetical protein